MPHRRGYGSHNIRMLGSYNLRGGTQITIANLFAVLKARKQLYTSFDAVTNSTDATRKKNCEVRCTCDDHYCAMACNNIMVLQFQNKFPENLQWVTDKTCRPDRTWKPSRAEGQTRQVVYTVQLKGNVASIHMRVMLASSHEIILLQCTVQYLWNIVWICTSCARNSPHMRTLATEFSSFIQYLDHINICDRSHNYVRASVAS